MKFLSLAVFGISIFTNQVMAAAIAERELQQLAARHYKPIEFYVAPLTPEGSASGCESTTGGHYYNLAPTAENPSKGNFYGIPAYMVVTQPAIGCYITLYSGENQSGDITNGLDASTAENCIFNSDTWQSYEVYCF